VNLQSLPLCQTASITTDAYDVNTDIEPRLRVFSEAGFRFLHWCDHWVSAHKYSDEETARTKGLLDQYGLACTDIHGVCAVEAGETLSLTRWVELNANRMDFIRALGGDAIVIHLPVPALAGATPELDLARELTDALLPEARSRGVRVAVENGNAGLIRELFDRYPPDDLLFCFDSGHSNMAGDLDTLETFVDRLLVVHLHDNHGQSDEHDLPGTGTTDWPRVMALLRRAPLLRTLNLEVGLRTDEERLAWARRAYASLVQLRRLLEG
jgi:sugar phosphate isomerase/epimerase